MSNTSLRRLELNAQASNFLERKALHLLCPRLCRFDLRVLGVELTLQVFLGRLFVMNFFEREFLNTLCPRTLLLVLLDDVA